MKLQSFPENEELLKKIFRKNNLISGKLKNKFLKRIFIFRKIGK